MHPRIGAHDTVADFLAHLRSLGAELPVDAAPLSAADGSPLAQPLIVHGRVLPNRWCIHPMEGWDGEADGTPSEHTRRRWRHFGESGAALLWGGEAFAVRADGRANPRQLFRHSENLQPMARLLDEVQQGRADVGADGDVLVGLQLTHSGRFCKPQENHRFEPRIAYHHPLLDARVGVSATDDGPLFQDHELPQLVADYVDAAKLAMRAGFDFVDVKACHGYLLHEFLSAFSRPGQYGGDFAGRTRLLKEIIAAIRTECPGLEIGVRMSVFDQPAWTPDPTLTTARKKGPGIVERWTGERYPAFGASANDPLAIDLDEPIRLLTELRDEYRVRLFNLTAGSPYYNPHLQRPAAYPPSDGYQPPEDPLLGCVRQFQAVRDVKLAVPDAVIVGTAYTYLQEFLPHVAQGVVRQGWADAVGLGRLVLSDWRFPIKVLRGEDYRADRKLCRTFSDCTTAPRNGLVSGCYPLDEAYKGLPEAAELKRLKGGRVGTSQAAGAD
ncbi:MAG: NADH:flavin oxidoreductase [Planctomyces sp.]|nr:NADH:flavin oxidoreductase [Planctomyces sp.]